MGAGGLLRGHRALVTFRSVVSGSLWWRPGNRKQEVAGVALRWYGIHALGQFFTLRVTTRVDHVVVDEGPYRLVRHPSYTGALMTVFGVLLCSTNWLALLCFALAWPGFAYRIRTEEAALTSALGEPYRQYMRRTKRLIPYVL